MPNLKDGAYTITNVAYGTGTFTAELAPQDDDYLTLKDGTTRWDIKYDEDKSGYILTNHTTKRVLDTYQESEASGARAIIAESSGSLTQVWAIKANTADQYQILNVSSGFALRASHQGGGYNIYQTEVKTESHEEWNFTKL